MENQNQTTGMPSATPNLSPEDKSHGSLIAVIVILLLIIVGGLYFLGQRMSAGLPSQPTSQDAAPDEVVESLNSQSESDEVDSIEADLNATDIDNLDQGAAALEAEGNL